MDLTLMVQYVQLIVLNSIKEVRLYVHYRLYFLFGRLCYAYPVGYYLYFIAQNQLDTFLKSNKY